MKRAAYPKVECAEFIHCPHCGVKLFDREDTRGDVICEHIVYIYIWGSDPDRFRYMRKDFAEKYLNVLKHSKEYKDLIADKEINPLTESEERIILSGKIMFSGVESRLEEKTQWILTGIIDRAKWPRNDEMTVYCSDGYYSGIHIAIDLGAKVRERSG